MNKTKFLLALLLLLAVGLYVRQDNVEAQTASVPITGDKLQRTVGPNDTVVWSPTDLGLNNAILPISASSTSAPVPVGKVHNMLVAFNCNQITNTFLVPVFEDGTTGTAVPLSTASTASQWDYVWVSDAMTSTAVGATAASARLPIGPQVQLTLTNTSGAATDTCKARIVSQY